jgi:hypothetical protein
MTVDRESRVPPALQIQSRHPLGEAGRGSCSHHHGSFSTAESRREDVQETLLCPLGKARATASFSLAFRQDAETIPWYRPMAAVRYDARVDPHVVCGGQRLG